MICVALTVGMLAGMPAATVAETITPEHVARIKYVGAAAVSPDGSLFAYVLSVPRNPFEEDNGRAWRQLHVCDREGNSRPFITDQTQVSSIAFTPDGGFVSFLAEKGEDTVKSLYRIPVSGGESQKLVDFGSGLKSYSWAPDGHRLAFLAREPRSDESVELRKQGFKQKIYEEDWRPVKVWLYDIDLPTVDPVALELPGSAAELHWSPDGDLLALALAPTPLIDDSYMARKVSLVDIATGDLVYRGDNQGKLGGFSWSPDGKHLAYLGAADPNDPQAGELYVLTVDGHEVVPVITDFEGHVRRMGWIDDETMLYLSDEWVHTVIGTVKKDGSDQKSMWTNTRPVFTRMYFSIDGKTAGLVGSSAAYPDELFFYDIGGNETVRLTNSNPWIDSLELADQEVVDYYARDSLHLQGILIRPLNEQSGQRYPLVMQVHGGPEAHRRDSWLTWSSSPGQVAAARGMAVFYPNYRGSTGRGVPFSKMGQAGYAEAEFDDLVDAINHLVNIGLVDRDKVGITGGSYGGYASAWGATALTEHFAASVMGVGISDLISKFGTTDIPIEMNMVHARSWPWDNWQWYLEQSPIYHAQKANTPILIMHGEDDTRVHPSQSMELYRYLKTVGKAPVRMVFYPGEGHGNKKAAARYDYSLRQLRWLEHYLIGPGGDPPPYEINYDALRVEE